MRRVIISRLSDDGVETLGRLHVYDDCSLKLQLCTLERPWKNNQHEISCIPPGRYVVTPRVSDHLGRHFLVNDVEGRDLICIHKANFVKDLLGCIGVGMTFADIDNNGEMDIASSGAAMSMLLECMAELDKFYLDIIGVL